MSYQTKSYWIKSPSSFQFPTLRRKKRVDVVIVGGGIAGLSAAIRLKNAGKTVAVVEQHAVSGGETGNTTAHITEILDTRYQKIQAQFGKKEGRQIADACRSANHQIAQWVERLKIDCDFEHVPGYLYTENKKEVMQLKDELVACLDVGLDSRWEERTPLPFQTYGSIRIENQAQFNPWKYARSLASKIQGEGSYVFENSRVLEMTEGEPCRVLTDSGEVLANELVVAANVPSINRVFLITKIASYRSYAVAATLKNPPLAHGLFWDTEDPYHYIRPYKDVWIVGGEDHKTGMEEDTRESYGRLIEYVDERFNADSIHNAWSGQIINSVDGLPYIGLNLGAKHTYVATGFGGNGMTFGSLAGSVISDLILKKENAWAEIFSPKRWPPVSSTSTFIFENKDYPICMMKDHLLKRVFQKPGNVDHLGLEEGCVIVHKGQEIAVYRDKDSELHSVSAVCPHLGCQVHWNRAEKSWDCPCHGSRFDTDGALLNGPATQDLAPVLYGKSKNANKKRAA